MSGVFHNAGDGQRWYENTDMICKRCRNPVYESDNSKYSYQCFRCDEDLFDIEVEEQDGLFLPRIVVARHLEGITINNELEYLLDSEDGDPLVFESQAAAEAHCLAGGLIEEDLEWLYFIEVDEVESLREGGNIMEEAE